MKNLLYIFLLLPIMAAGQTTTQNYIKTLTYKDPATSSNEAAANVSVVYYDGLGRPIQQVSGKMSATGTDIITHIEYDSFGRQSKDYLPFAATSTNLAFDGAALTTTNTYYNNTANVDQITGNPYSQKFFEPSPLNRVLKQAAPGNAWIGNADVYNNNDHTVKVAYQTNTSDGSVNDVKKLSVTAALDGNNIFGTLTFNSAAAYPAGQLYKTVTKNENWISGTANTTEEYKNKEGQVVLKRNYNGSAYDTYYVYDQFGNLTYVLPPLANGTTTYLNTLGYQYKYDKRNRLAEKKLPGKQWEFIVYDPLDRPVRTGPSLTPFGGYMTSPNTDVGWMMTIYDGLGRPAITGWYQSTVSAGTRASVQATITTVLMAVRGSGTMDGVAVGYNNLSLPPGFRLLTVNYYDDYTWPGAPTNFDPIEGQNIRTQVKGMPTGSWVRVMDASNVKSEVSYTLYDNRSRAVSTRTANYLGGYTQVDTKLDFDGSPLKTTTFHKRLTGSTPDVKVEENFTYTAQDRLLSHTHRINNLATQTLSSNTYNKLGQLTNKAVGSYTSGFNTIPMQTIDYKYNIRGWLTDINDPLNSLFGLGSKLFGFHITYNNPTDVTGGVEVVPGLYNGNISETFWRTKGDNVLRKYSYRYDNLNRLTNAYYQKPNATSKYTRSYNENIRYDANGNITGISRNGAVDDLNTPVQIDLLTYTYPVGSNQLTKVYDESNSPQGFRDIDISLDDYTYDTNGNMLTDLNKGITTTNPIKYNHLNLPVEINFGGGNKIVYLYDAAGRKLKKTVTEVISGTTTTIYVDYLSGGFQYKGGVLQFFPTAEGYVDNTVVSGVNNYNYVYQYKDHLGNVRLNYGVQTAKGVTSVVIKEENHYYPFGLKHLNYNMDYLEYEEIEGEIVLYPPLNNSKLVNNYKYQGQERQDELGLGWDSFKYRNYDYALGRFMSIDPLAEKYAYETPYQFSSNQPVHANEIEGLESRSDLNLTEKPSITNDVIARTVIKPAPLATDKPKPVPTITKPATISQGFTPAQLRQNEAKAAELAKVKDAVQNHDNLGNAQTATKYVAKPAFFAISFYGMGGAAAAAETVEGTVVIGEGMSGVHQVANTLRTAGFEGVETFEASETALSQWNSLISNGTRVSDEVAKGTTLFQENQVWIQGVKNSGKAVIDIGNDGRAVESTFYQMEKAVMYGPK
ncbi:DUF6443 domain-containing protein [Flavobacterium sp. RHBU_24]|uniref:DUF6443 domain-containing protein n=1 Tax=Flavobacterium sp. RHBU_24 TaxID=3391185 RepID=UPI0039853602